MNLIHSWIVSYSNRVVWSLQPLLLSWAQRDLILTWQPPFIFSPVQVWNYKLFSWESCHKMFVIAAYFCWFRFFFGVRRTASPDMWDSVLTVPLSGYNCVTGTGSFFLWMLYHVCVTGIGTFSCGHYYRHKSGHICLTGTGSFFVWALLQTRAWSLSCYWN